MISARNRICMFNDLLRRHRTGGQIVITSGIQALGPDLLMQLLQAVAAFDGFSPYNDPYGEHDFGAVCVHEHTVFFKIDAYDLDLSCRSPDPADPAVTRRVMTIMLVEEY